MKPTLKPQPSKSPSGTNKMPENKPHQPNRRHEPNDRNPDAQYEEKDES
ncbi:MAG: hypothetical protein PW734_12105 [Verrucomicrobium sp.]|nr:hypothetical protein [Verrucomicrobium sp.]